MTDEFRPTVAQRLIIGMLCDIYDHLKVDGAYDTSLIKEAAVGPHHWALERQYTFQKHIDNDVADEVYGILEMWDIIEWSYEQLPQDDRAGLKEPEFRGFDGNMENDHYSVADVMINRMDYFERFKDRGLNSHYPSLGKYRDMLPQYSLVKEDLLKAGDNLALTKGQIGELLEG